MFYCDICEKEYLDEAVPLFHTGDGTFYKICPANHRTLIRKEVCETVGIVDKGKQVN